MFSTKTELEMMNQQKLSEEDSAAQLRSKLNSMKGGKASKKSIALAILKLIPFFNRFFMAANDVGNVVINLVLLEGQVSQAAKITGDVFSIFKLIFAALDFVRVPCIYLGAMIAGQKPPFTLSRNARFLYAAVLLGLTITAFAFPPAAPIIALVSALFALGMSVVTFAKLSYKRYELEDKLKTLESAIKSKKVVAISLINRLEDLERAAKDAQEKNQPDFLLLEKIKKKREQIIEQLNTLQGLYNTQEECKQKIEELGMAATLDKTMGVVIASLGVIGAVVSIILPPVGLIMLAVAASIGFAYLAGRLTYSLYTYLGAKLSKASPKAVEPEEGELNRGLNHDLADSDNATFQFDPQGIKAEVERLEKLIAGEGDTPVMEHPDSRVDSLMYRSTSTLFDRKKNQQLELVYADDDDDDEGEQPAM